MRRYLLDTGIAGDYIDRRNNVFDRAKKEASRGNRIGICVPVLGELYYGVEFSQTRKRNLKRLRFALSTLTIWPYTEEAAAEYGRLFAELRRLGRPCSRSTFKSPPLPSASAVTRLSAVTGTLPRSPD